MLSFSLQDGRTPLGFAAGFGHVDCVKVLLDRDANIDHQTKVSLTYSTSLNDWTMHVLLGCG